MGLFNRVRAEEPIDPSWVRVTALVLAADAPPQGAPSRGPYSQGTLQVVIHTPTTGRRVLSAPLRFTDAHWLTMGLPVPVALDPVHPDVFVVDWAAVPAMQQLAEANHPALADPFTAARQVAAAAGLTPNEKTAARAERFQVEVARAATRPAPAGRLPATAVVVTVRGRFESTDGSDDDGAGATRSGVTFHVDSAAVLSVATPGRPPYAVYLAKFKIPRRRLTIPGEPMPVLVSATDPRHVEIRWDEMPSLDDQIAARISDQSRSTEKLTAAMSQQYQAAIAEAIANPPAYPPAAYPPAAYPPAAYPPGTHPPGTYPPPQPAAGYPAAQPAAAGYPGAPPAGMPPQVRQMMIENLRRSLVMVDPAHRRMVLDQYRAMGLAITEEELGI